MSKYVKIQDFYSGFLSIPNCKTASDVSLAVQSVIDEYEPDIYRQIFGLKIASEMFAENPKDWAKTIAQEFVKTAKYGIFAYWITYNSQRLTEAGMVAETSAISRNVGSMERFVDAWNMYIDRAKEALHNLDKKQIPSGYKIHSNLKYTNIFGI